MENIQKIPNSLVRRHKVAVSYLAELDEGRVHDRHEVLEADVAAESSNFVHELHDGDLGTSHLRHVTNLHSQNIFILILLFFVKF